MEEAQITPTANKDEEMAISDAMRRTVDSSSWIRLMFEEGARLKEVHGKDNVFDFTLGNPSVPPPPAFFDLLQKTAKESGAEDHRYMNNTGLLSVRSKIAARLAAEHDLAIDHECVVMTCGAAGALNILLKSILDPGDEIIILTPYFPEYLFYIENHGGVPVLIDTDDEFQPVKARIARALTPRTRAIVINTPNNPTGAVYTQETVNALGLLVDDHTAKHGRNTYLFLDEPYRRIRYTEQPHPSIFEATTNGILITSYSKDLGLAGERIGYAALHPELAGRSDLFAALSIATRVLGFVNASAFMQRVVAECGDLAVDVDAYRRNRDQLYGELKRIGYEMIEPGGSFFLFPKAPGGDDVEFCSHLKEHRVLCVPGLGFGRSGHIRISYAVHPDVIGRSIPAFERAFGEF